jgi:hypothetical protein
MFDCKKEKKEKKDNKLFDKTKKPECCSVNTPNACKEKKESEKVAPKK